MARLNKFWAVLILCAFVANAAAQSEEKAAWADLEFDAGILGLSSMMMSSSSPLTIYDPQDYSGMVSFQLSRVKKDKWGMWFGILNSWSEADLREEAIEFRNRLMAQHPNDFIFSVRDASYSIKYKQTHFHFGALRRKKLGAVHLNFGAGLGAYKMVSESGLRFVVKEQGSNVRSEYTYNYGEENKWNWSATAYVDADMNLYRSGRMEWNVFGRVSCLGFGKISTFEERKAPLHVPATSTFIEDEGQTLRADVVFGLRMRIINMQGWKMFNR